MGSAAYDPHNAIQLSPEQFQDAIRAARPSHVWAASALLGILGLGTGGWVLERKLSVEPEDVLEHVQRVERAVAVPGGDALRALTEAMERAETRVVDQLEARINADAVRWATLEEHLFDLADAVGDLSRVIAAFHPETEGAPPDEPRRYR